MILTYVEHDEERPVRSSLEALTVARGLAERTGEPLEAILVGAGAAEAAAGLGAYGVTRAHVVADPPRGLRARGLGTEPRHVRRRGRRIRGPAAGTDRGQEVLAHAAAMSGRPMAANCVEIQAGDPFRVIRQRWGGSLLEDATVEGPVRYLTVAEHVAEPTEAAARTDVAVEVVRPTVGEADLRSRVVARVAPRRARSPWPMPGSSSGAGVASVAARPSPSSRSWPACSVARSASRGS